MGRISAVALGATLMIVTASSAVAQQGGNGYHRGRHGGSATADGSQYAARRPEPMRALLRGVQLTDAQKAQVKAIHERYQPQFKALRDSLRPAAEQARAARQHGDTTTARQAWAQGADERQRMMTLVQKEAGEIRAVLTPDQQKVFDQNLAEWRDHARDARRARAGDGDRGHHGRPGAEQ